MLTDFNKTILIVALVVLVVSLVLLGYFITVSMHNKVYPPIINKCPDYWDAITNPSGCKSTTINTSNNADKYESNIECNVFKNSDFDEATKENNICEKQKYAKFCGITWDGITNNTLDCSNY